MRRTRIIHFFPTFHTLGGVESMLRRHYAQDERFGLESVFAILFEPENELCPRIHFLGLDESLTVGAARARVKNVMRAHKPDVVVYHSLDWLHHFADIDGGQRRILVFHVESPGWAQLFGKCEKWLDGVLCVSKPQVRNLAARFPRFSGERVQWLPYSIDPPAAPEPTRDEEGPLVLGICGRLIVDQKRVDRVPALCAALDRAGVKYRLEFLGDGPERGWLERQLPNRERFFFHGRKSGEEYWRIVSGWDCLLSVTDYEGTSIALLEAMSVGVVPIAPQITSGGDDYVAAVKLSHLYEPGHFGLVAAALREFQQLDPERKRAMRGLARQVVSPHIGDAYLRTFSSFIQRTLEAPRIAARFSIRARALSGLTFTMLGRISRWRYSQKAATKP